MIITDKVALGTIAVIAGIIVLACDDSLRVVVGVFLIVWGVLTWLSKRPT